MKLRYILTILALFTPLIIGAQQESPTSLVLSSTPTHPGAYEKVTLNVDYYLSDLDRATISWYINDALVERGTGSREINLTTGGIGEEKSIRASVTTKEGKSLFKTIKIIPADLDILWEAYTHTPTFYKGKSLASADSIVRFSAIPHFISGKTTINDQNLFFDWQTDGEIIGNSSGNGRSTVLVRTNTGFSDTNVSVTASSLNKTIVKEKSITINSTQPEIIFYEYSPLIGPIYNRALSLSHKLDESEISIKSEPYFFSSEIIDDIDYKWMVGRDEIKTDESGLVTITRNSASNGTLQLQLFIKSLGDILQFANNSLVINF